MDKLNASFCCILLVCGVFLVSATIADQEDSSDSVIVKVSPTLARRARQLLYYTAVQPSFGPAWSLREGNTCITSKNHIGTCTTYRSCYPYFKIPDITIWESWILGNYDTCSFFGADGRQTFGVCCSNPITTTTETPVEDEANDGNNFDQVDDTPMNGSAQKENNYPNWPPPIPTHPPDHAAPTHPPQPTGGSTTGTTPTPFRPPSTWPTKPTTVASNWPPALPTHTTTGPPNVFVSTTETSIDNEVSSAEFARCGVKNGNPDQERIVGGQNADPNEWPWIAVLFNNGRQFCGGSLIDESHILTAAHCVAHMNPWDVARLTVRLGDHNIKSNTEVKHVERRIKRLVRHRGFDSRTLYNDVAVLTMDSPVEFSRTVRAVCLPVSGGRSYAGQTATVIGWGSLRESGPQPAILQEVTIPVWGNAECRSKYGSAAPGGIVDSMLCAGKAAKDSCSGDSGGPLIVTEGNRWTQAGIVSWGIGCGKGQYPGVYTRVSHFMPWITKNIKDKKL